MSAPTIYDALLGAEIVTRYLGRNGYLQATLDGGFSVVLGSRTLGSGKTVEAALVSAGLIDAQRDLLTEATP